VHETVTDIQIQPSQSYELKDPSGYQGHQQQHSQEQQYYQQQPQQHNNEPVIVLRIPGPQKYAAHLQALLQVSIPFPICGSNFENFTFSNIWSCEPHNYLKNLKSRNKADNTIHKLKL
jgi:hypothetical protein